MDSSPGFVSTPCDCRCLRSVRPLQTRFPYGSGCLCLNLATHSNSLAHSPKGTPSHKTIPKNRHRAPTACRRPVSDSISLPSPGFFSPFPHGTCSLSVVKSYLALGSGLPCFPQGSSCPVVLRISSRVSTFLPTGLSPSAADLSSVIRLKPTFLSLS